MAKKFNDWLGVPGTCGSCTYALWVEGRICLPTGEPLSVCLWRPPKDFSFPPMPLAWGYIDGCQLVHSGDYGCPVYKSEAVRG